MSTFQENENDGLTAEELAALSAPDDGSEKQVFNPDAEVEHVNEEETPPAQDAAPASEPAADPGAAAGADDAQSSVAADAAPQAQADPSPAVEAPKVATAAPLLIVAAPEDAQAKLKEIEVKKAAIRLEYEDGNLTQSEKDEKLDALNDEKYEIRRLVDRAELAKQLEEQRINNEWTKDYTNFLGNYAEYKDEKRMAQMHHTIIAIAQMPENWNLTNHEALVKAHAMVRALNGESVDDAPAKADGKPVHKQLVVPKPDAPPNIGALPTAALNDTTGGEFASIESLRKSGDVEAYERALEGLSEAQAARYFRT